MQPLWSTCGCCEFCVSGLDQLCQSVDQAIRATRPGCTIVIGVNASVGALPFALEKNVVGSLLGTRQQMREVLDLAAAGKIKAQCQPFALEDATAALTALKRGEVRARAVLMVRSEVAARSPVRMIFQTRE